MQYKNLVLDPFQEDAIRAIEENKSVVVSAPTGSGKTLIADYIIGKYIKEGKKVIYTAPIKALSNQKYKEFSADYGEENVGLLTGDISKNGGAPVVIMTTEIYRNMAITRDAALATLSYVIFDEIHFINDIERGYVWEESIIFSQEHVRFLCLSATIPNAKEFAEWIAAIKRHEVAVVRHEHRPVPLYREWFDAEAGITTLEHIREVRDIPQDRYIRGRTHHRTAKTKAPSHTDLIRDIQDKLPCFFFVFSRQKCQDYAAELAQKNIFPYNQEITAFVREKLATAPQEINSLKSTQLMRQVLPYGIAFHHAGLLPVIKDTVEELFGKGLIHVLYTTETFAVGINMPAKAVCFDSLRKFDGITFRYLNSKEYFQIAGRAGRRGIDNAGYAYVMVDRRDFNYGLYRNITEKDVDPILSQFRLSVNTVLNLIKRHTQEEIDEILCKSFYTYQKYGRRFDKVAKHLFAYKFEAAKKKLIKMGYIANDRLTDKGEFGSHIYSDEILTSELFATSFYGHLNEYQIMLLVAAICYEFREKTEFYHQQPSKALSQLKHALKNHHTLEKEKRFRSLDDLTSLVHPCFYGKNVLEIVKNTNLLEGDIIRFFRQMLDRFGQIRNATRDLRLVEICRSCEQVIQNCLKDIDTV
ncbi:TPA: DEAD/DEAH box helicase [Candidatus Woesearchaeota archaeon]|nr:DEAD/DEAH box helicase [Candidatus Woesearchaeota archaeon]